MNRIIKLPLDVVNKIAAGEIIQRPANAIKELIENCLDAGSTTITVSVREGGLKSFTVMDNGHGIQMEDMEILCERHTTSKLRSFEDLRVIQSFGFRGEALASISHVAHVSVTTMTDGSPCAYSGAYFDGKLCQGPPKPCAGNRGTSVLVEDLFFNLKQRRQALSNGNKELKKILYVLQRYALHYSGVAVILKKYGNNTPLICTQCDSTIESNIGLLFGSNILSDLVHLDESDSTYSFRLEGYVTNSHHQAKQLTFILFIGGRLVESGHIKRAVNDVYSHILPKGKHPFVYLRLDLKPENVDVNVHPTKSEVRFLHQESIVERIRDILEKQVKHASTSRGVQVSTRASLSNPVSMTTWKDNAPPVSPAYTSQQPPTWNKIRVDSKFLRLESFMSQNAQEPAESTLAPRASHRSTKRRRTALASVLQLTTEIRQSKHAGLEELFANHVFVGCVDCNTVLVQHRTSLYLVDVPKVVGSFLYQTVLENWENFACITLSNPPGVDRLLEIALQHGPESEKYSVLDEAGKMEWIAGYMELLCNQNTRGILKKYVCVDIDEQGRLCSLPILIPRHVPEWHMLPLFVLNLATRVSFDNEKECFRGLAQQLAVFYSPSREERLDAAAQQDAANGPLSQELKQRWWNIEHILFDALKTGYQPEASLANDNSVIQVASLDKLYKVFERC